MARPPGSAWRLNVLAYDGCFGTEIFGLVDVLAVANAVAVAMRPGTPTVFQTRIVSAAGGRVTLSGGTVVSTQRADAGADQLVVPGCFVSGAADLGPLVARLGPEVGYLRGMATGKVKVASVCVGAFLLGEAGLLDGHIATTAWLFAPELARRYPRVDVRASSMVVHDGRVTTAGAFSAGHDLALQLVRAHAGDAIARATSNLTLVSDSRRTQSPFVDDAMLPVNHAQFSDDVKRCLRLRIADRYDLTALAGELNVSTRTLLRRFLAETGQSPLGWLQQTRVTAAKRLLETSELSVHEITARVGYTDDATFRRLFTSLVGTTPSDYRRQRQTLSA